MSGVVKFKDSMSITLTAKNQEEAIKMFEDAFKKHLLIIKC